jgi:dolichol kinase
MSQRPLPPTQADCTLPEKRQAPAPGWVQSLCPGWQQPPQACRPGLIEETTLPAFAWRASMAASVLTLAAHTLAAAARARTDPVAARKKSTPTKAPSQQDLVALEAGHRDRSPLVVHVALTAACLGVAAAVVGAGSVRGATPHEGIAVTAVAGAGAVLVHLIMECLPRTFTLGECMVAGHAAALVGAHALVLGATRTLGGPPTDWLGTGFSAFVTGTVVAAVAAAATLLPLLEGGTRGRAVAAVLVGGICLFAVQPAAWCLSFATATPQRTSVLAYWAALLGFSLPAMWLASRSIAVSVVLLRKGYHILAAALFLPALFLEPQLLGVALAVAFAVLVVVEVVRLGRVPWVSKWVASFMGAFIDSRDSGRIFTTHFTLLLGMAAPVWLSNALEEEEVVEGGDVWPAAMAGILILGVGDAVAAAVGKAVGRTPMCYGSTKTVEGTAAGVVATMLAWALALWASGATWPRVSWAGAEAGSVDWGLLVAATAASSALEGVTEQLDNLFVPLHYFSLLLCL